MKWNMHHGYHYYVMIMDRIDRKIGYIDELQIIDKQYQIFIYFPESSIILVLIFSLSNFIDFNFLNGIKVA